MKKSLLVFALLMLGNMAVKAQTDYRATLGVGIDLYGGDSTFFGASGKYFFSEKHVGQVLVYSITQRLLRSCILFTRNF